MNELESIVLEAVKQLGDNAYGVPLRQKVEGTLGKPVAIVMLYAVLEQLKERGIVCSYPGESTPERGGRPKRYWRPAETDEGNIAAFLQFIRGEGHPWGKGITSHVDDERPAHAICLELERRGLIYRHYESGDGKSVTWKPIEEKGNI